MIIKPIQLNDYKTTVVKNKNRRGSTYTFVTASQRSELLQHLGDSCFILFSYYIEKANIEGFDYDDKRAAKALFYTKRKVGNTRRKLIKYGWFYQSTYKNKVGRRVIMTFLGRAAVSTYIRDGEIIRISELSL